MGVWWAVTFCLCMRVCKQRLICMRVIWLSHLADWLISLRCWMCVPKSSYVSILEAMKIVLFSFKVVHFPHSMMLKHEKHFYMPTCVYV